MYRLEWPFMGGVEDDEPPAKRVKLSSQDIRGIYACVSGRSSLSDLMARPLESEGDGEVVGSKGVVKKVELVRIIAEALYSLGYSKTGKCLEEESGIELHSTAVELFKQQILNGQWDESLTTLRQFGLMDETIIKMASCLILEQKFFEFLDGGKIMDALKTLRTEITPISASDGKVRKLSTLIVSPSQDLVDGTSGQKSRFKSHKKLLEELQTFLPPSLMIQEKRLVFLVEQALALQEVLCRFHNSPADRSLFTDHRCGRHQIPSHTLQILEDHSDEVWFLQFSHNGKFLASSSSDCSAIIWEVISDGRVSLKYRLSGHQKPVSYISWSPDDNQLLTCGVEETVRRWDIASGECLHIYEKNGFGLVSCGWALDGKSILAGVVDKSISVWDLEGNELDSWMGARTSRIADLGVSADGELITVCKTAMILLFPRERKSGKVINEIQPIVSFALSGDRKFLLVSLLNAELHLWNIDGCTKLVARFRGHKRSRFVVRSCFGGQDQSFIASGSEDSQVYIWYRSSTELLLKLAGHTGAVNCVSWNPANPRMLASASDDRTIRIWGLNEVDMNYKAQHNNGAHCSNGKT